MAARWPLGGCQAVARSAPPALGRLTGRFRVRSPGVWGPSGCVRCRSAEILGSAPASHPLLAAMCLRPMGSAGQAPAKALAISGDVRDHSHLGAKLDRVSLWAARWRPSSPRAQPMRREHPAMRREGRHPNPLKRALGASSGCSLAVHTPARRGREPSCPAVPPSRQGSGTARTDSHGGGGAHDARRAYRRAVLGRCVRRERMRSQGACAGRACGKLHTTSMHANRRTILSSPFSPLVSVARASAACLSRMGCPGRVVHLPGRPLS